MTAELVSWDIAPSYIDARGQPQPIDPAVAQTLARLLESGGTKGEHRKGVTVLSSQDPPLVRVSDCGGTFGWRLLDRTGAFASGESRDATVVLPDGLAVGSYRLAIDAADGRRCESLVLATPGTAYQPPQFREGGRAWIFVVQLYGVRSRHNWGHGDFGDLTRLLEIASTAGASGIGLNPLHALAPGQASAYSPSRRIFLNPLYVDGQAIEEFPGVDACGLTEEVARLQHSDIVDYLAVHAAKYKALRATYEAFRQRATAERRNEFDAFRQRLGAALERFAIF